jgi:hypothetical protein
VNGLAAPRRSGLRAGRGGASRWLAVAVVVTLVVTAVTMATPARLAGQTPERGPCGPEPLSLLDALQQADVVFVGLVDSVERTDSGAGTGNTTVAQFRVAAAFSPDVGPTAMVYTCCLNRVEFQPADLYYVFASREADGSLHTDVCMRTFSLSDPPEAVDTEDPWSTWPTPVWTAEDVVEQWTPQLPPSMVGTATSWAAEEATGAALSAAADATATSWLALAPEAGDWPTDLPYWPTEDWSAYPGYEEAAPDVDRAAPQPTAWSPEDWGGGGGGGGTSDAATGPKAEAQAGATESRRPPFVALSVLAAVAVAAGLSWWAVRSAR